MTAEEQTLNPSHAHSATGLLCKAALSLICEHWFILGVGFAIGFAAAVPNLGTNGGWVRAEYTVKYGAVIIIFLLSGLSLKSKVLLQAAQRAHLHLYIQALCLGLTPLIGFGVVQAMRQSTWLNQDLVSGLMICTSMPTTVSTNVVFTKQAGGNDAVALINAVIGNIIGIFVSPGLLSAYLHESGQAPYSDVLMQLGVTVIAPLVVGQLAQYLLPNQVSWLQARVNFGKLSNIMILLLVWNTFCNTFASKVSAGAGSLVLVISMCVLLYGVFTIICFGVTQGIVNTPWLQRWFKITRSDTVAVMMCGATKTLALGMPLVSVLYGKQSNVGLLALPLITYHASQILQGNLLIKPLKRWSTAEATLPATKQDAAEKLAASGGGCGEDITSTSSSSGSPDAASISGSQPQLAEQPGATKEGEPAALQVAAREAKHDMKVLEAQVPAGVT